jgi:hypothetical protein
MTTTERTPQEWFHEAARCYIEMHQGCAWCGGAHQVHHRSEGNKMTYSCHRCDFRVSRDLATGHCTFVPGEHKKNGAVPDTMFEI